jgi:hypothetical protein
MLEKMRCLVCYVTFKGTLLERQAVTYTVQQMLNLRNNSSGIWEEEFVGIHNKKTFYSVRTFPLNNQDLSMAENSSAMQPFGMLPKPHRITIQIM